MMAWGLECSAWDDSVDWANQNAFDPEEIPEGSFVVTTWHEEESLADVFWYAKHCATHSVVDIGQTLLLHIAAEQQETDMLDRYAAA